MSNWELVAEKRKEGGGGVVNGDGGKVRPSMVHRLLCRGAGGEWSRALRVKGAWRICFRFLINLR